jgi:hypothetical protein
VDDSPTSPPCVASGRGSASSRIVRKITVSCRFRSRTPAAAGRHGANTSRRGRSGHHCQAVAGAVEHEHARCDRAASASSIIGPTKTCRRLTATPRRAVPTPDRPRQREWCRRAPLSRASAPPRTSPARMSWSGPRPCARREARDHALHRADVAVGQPGIGQQRDDATQRGRFTSSAFSLPAGLDDVGPHGLAVRGQSPATTRPRRASSRLPPSRDCPEPAARPSRSPSLAGRGRSPRSWAARCARATLTRSTCGATSGPARPGAHRAEEQAFEGPPSFVVSHARICFGVEAGASRPRGNAACSSLSAATDPAKAARLTLRPASRPPRRLPSRGSREAGCRWTAPVASSSSSAGSRSGSTLTRTYVTGGVFASVEIHLSASVSAPRRAPSYAERACAGGLRSTAEASSREISGGVLFIAGPPEVIYANDVHYRYRLTRTFASSRLEASALILSSVGTGAGSLCVRERRGCGTWNGKRG